MSFTLELQTAPRLGLEVSPALVVFGELLLLPGHALRDLVEDELADNGALVRLEPGRCPVCRDRGRPGCPACTPRGTRPRERSGPLPEPADAEPDSVALLRAVRLELSGRDAALAEEVVGRLDEHGILDTPPVALARELRVDEGAVLRVLDVVRRTAPPGVGATSVAESLVLQLDALGLDDPVAALARTVLTEHLPALARGHLASVAAALGVPRTRVEEVLDLVRHRLHPHPAYAGTARPRRDVVVPDVVVHAPERPGDDPAVELVEPAALRLGLRGGAHPRDAVRARAFLALLDDRWSTLARVADVAVRRQREFLLHGPAALRPLTRAEVAAALDLHESTVSRAVAGRTVLLPDRSTVPLARFFGAAGALDAELRRLLDEVPGASDQRLSELLTAAGVPVSRRTVAKHRARLGIGSTLVR